MDKDLIDKILDASNKIHKASLRGSANYIITSQSVSNIINNISNKEYYRMEKIKRMFNV
jgi:hypothetical protein